MMKKAMSTCMLAWILALVMLLSSCGVPSLKYDAAEKGYVRSSDDTVFLRAPKNYIANAINTEKKLAELKLAEEELALYAVCGDRDNSDMDTNVWLADENYNLYYAKGTVLPKLWEMKVNGISILQNTEEAFSLGEVTKEADILSVINTYRNGETYSFVDLRHTIATMTHRVDYHKFNLVFSSDNYPGVCYTLILYHFTNDVYLSIEAKEDSSLAYSLEAEPELKNVGRNIIYDPETGLCYSVKDVFDSFFNKSAA